MATATVEYSSPVVVLRLSEEESKVVFATLNFVYGQLDPDSNFDTLLGQVIDRLGEGDVGDMAPSDTYVTFKESVTLDDAEDYNFEVHD